MAKEYPNNPFNILGVYFSASTQVKHEGMNWYNDAFKIAEKIALPLGAAPAQVAGVIAALSPNVRWERNVTDAEHLMNAHNAGAEDWRTTKVSAYPLNRAKAVTILDQDYELPEPILGVLNGNKTKAFFTCIENPRDSHAVCVDGHARCIFYGVREALKSKSMGDREYHHIANAYREAARIITDIEGELILPMQVQAVTWCQWRIHHGIA